MADRDTTADRQRKVTGVGKVIGHGCKRNKGFNRTS